MLRITSSSEISNSRCLLEYVSEATIYFKLLTLDMSVVNSLGLHLLFNASNIPSSAGLLFVFVPPWISAVARFFFSIQLLDAG